LSASSTGRLYPQECSWYSFSLGAESIPGKGLEGDMSLKNPVTPPGFDPGTVRLVAQGLNHYATPHHSQYALIRMKKTFALCRNLVTIVTELFQVTYVIRETK
jgi:hypothetical protein